MKKLLILLLLSTSFSTFSEIDGREIFDYSYDYSLSEFCMYQPGIQDRGDEIYELYFPNEEVGITATSVCVMKDAYGQIGYKGELIKGIQQGTWIDYFTNGRKQEEVNYKDGILHGMTTWWSKTGQKLGEINFENGKYAGESLGWFPNGQAREKMYYKDGELDGTATWWQLDGKKWIEAVFKNGKRIGECKILSEWDLEKLAVERSPSFADEFKRYTHRINSQYCDEKLDDQQQILRSAYINHIAAKVRSYWMYQGAEDDWGCEVYIKQSIEGVVEAVDVQNCTLDDSEKAKSFKNSIERAVYKASPLPVAPDDAVFDKELLFFFRVN